MIIDEKGRDRRHHMNGTRGQNRRDANKRSAAEGNNTTYTLRIGPGLPARSLLGGRALVCRHTLPCRRRLPVSEPVPVWRIKARRKRIQRAGHRGGTGERCCFGSKDWSVCARRVPAKVSHASVEGEEEGDDETRCCRCLPASVDARRLKDSV